MGYLPAWTVRNYDADKEYHSRAGLEIYSTSETTSHCSISHIHRHIKWQEQPDWPGQGQFRKTFIC